MSGAPQTNGPSSPTGKYIDTIDQDDEEYKKNMRRPAEVKEDLNQMSNRSRVSLILNSEAFRRELEEIVDEQIRAGNHPASLIALQQISDLLVPNKGYPQGSTGTLGRSGGASYAIPISDIKGSEAMGYTKGEKLLRCKLAACYRLVDMNGWGHGIYNHISARINQEQEHFLINPFGMNYSEITASSLVKIDIRGEVIDPGTTTFGVNTAGFNLHSAIHQFRPDIKCIIHLHTPTVVAVSGMKCGVLALSQEACICGEISYHDYNGILVDPEEKESLQRDLGPINKVMVLRNHGIVACGTTVEEAYHFAFNTVTACDAQVKAIPTGVENLTVVSQAIKQKAFSVANQGGGGVDTSGKKWKIGELEFEAQMRLLDNRGFRTGYKYKNPNVKREVRREKSNADVEIPPTSSSFTYVFDGDVEHSKYVSPIKAAMERQKQQHKVGWLNSPNVYVRQDVDEIGTQNPKKITKWVKDETEEGSPKKGGASTVRVDNPNVFAPQGSDPKEFKQKQKQIKKDYYEERISAGPSSKVLEGISWEEAEKMKDGSLSTTGDSVIVIGAASKGIIQRDQQHNVQVYKTQYAANPFENMSEEEIERYKFEVEHKGLETVNEEDQLEPGPEGKLVSTEERIQNIQQQQQQQQPAGDISEDGQGDGYKVNARKRAEAGSTSSAGDVSDSVFSPHSPTSPVTPVTPTSPAAPAAPTSNTPPPDPPSPVTTNFSRSESARYPPQSPQLIEELRTSKNFDRSKSERKPSKNKKEKAMNGDDDQMRSPAKSDTLRSTDSASGGETLEERSSKESSPTKEHASPTKDKKKKKKFRMPSFSKTKKHKDSKESAI